MPVPIKNNSPRPNLTGFALQRSLHRVAGVAAGIILLYLAITGIPLQFTQWLGLDSRYVHNTWVLDFYGFGAPDEGSGVNETVFIGGQLYWRYRFLTEQPDFIGSIRHGPWMVVAGRHQLLVFDPQSPDIRDEIRWTETIEKIGRANDRLYLFAEGRLLQLDGESLTITPAARSPHGIRWVIPQPLSAQALAPYQQAFRQRLLPYERFLQDLHSGRLFGVVGVWLVNLAGLGLVLLSITGLSIWWRTRPPKELS